MELEKFSTMRDLQELLGLRHDLERLEHHSPSDGDLGPRLDLLDLGDAYQVLVEVPGVAQDDLEVALEGHSLTVAGLREPLPEDARLLRGERLTGPFQRTLELPGAVAKQAASARLVSGLLVLHLPKA